MGVDDIIDAKIQGDEPAVYYESKTQWDFIGENLDIAVPTWEVESADFEDKDTQLPELINHLAGNTKPTVACVCGAGMVRSVANYAVLKAAHMDVVRAPDSDGFAYDAILKALSEMQKKDVAQSSSGINLRNREKDKTPNFLVISYISLDEAEYDSIGFIFNKLGILKLQGKLPPDLKILLIDESESEDGDIDFSADLDD